MANLELEVWIDIGFIAKEPVKIGCLKHDRGNIYLKETLQLDVVVKKLVIPWRDFEFNRKAFLIS